MGLSVFMSIILCPAIISLQFFKEILKRRASAYGCSSFSPMGIIFKPDTIAMRDSIKSKVLGEEGVGFGEEENLSPERFSSSPIASFTP